MKEPRTMALRLDIPRGKNLARLLYECYSSTGIHGRTEMPEDLSPAKVKKGSLEHLLFITLTVAIDYQRDAPALWESSRRTLEDPDTQYLFDPAALHKAPPRQVVKDMQRYGLSKKPKKDANIWRTIGITFLKKWEGDPRNFLQDSDYDSLEILRRLREDTHIYNGKPVSDYPYLRGPKIAPLWLRMLRDNVGITDLSKMAAVPIPVDIHVARSTLATGVVRGKVTSRLADVFEEIRRVWFESVKGLQASNREMMALDLDEPLWNLSKYGCTKRNRDRGECPVMSACEARDFCVPGKLVIEREKVDLDT